MKKSYETPKRVDAEIEIRFLNHPIPPRTSGKRTSKWMASLKHFYTGGNNPCLEMTLGNADSFKQYVHKCGGKLAQRGHKANDEIPEGKCWLWLTQDTTKPGTQRKDFQVVN